MTSSSSSFGLWTAALGVWAALAGPTAHGAHATPLARQLEDQQQLQQQQQQQQQQVASPPLLLSFTSPNNGSRVEGPDVSLHYKIFTGDRELTRTEVKDLAKTTTVCFKLHGFNDAPEICAPLRVSAVTIRDALPAKWHTVTSTIKNSKTGRLLGGSNGGVSVFNDLNGYGVLDMCGESACLDSSDLRAAYFDYIYR